MSDATRHAGRTPRGPACWRLGWEARSAVEAAAWAGVRAWRRLPPGDGHTVVVLPGFGAGDVSTSILRAELRRLSYDVRGWALGVNRGNVEDVFPAVAEAVAKIAASTGPVSLVGWSLGGVIAREAARVDPAAVRRVITLGTPVVGGPKYTQIGRLYRLRGHDLDAFERHIEALCCAPLRVPVTAVFSKTDGVVDWPACIDPWNAHVEHVEVRSSHLGMGCNPAVLAVVADRLSSTTEPPAGEVRGGIASVSRRRVGDMSPDAARGTGFRTELQ